MTPYEILGLKSTATPEEIKSAHRRLVKKLHPDANGGKSSDRFKEVQRAYEVLIHPERRQLYDETGTTEKNQFDPHVAVSQLIIQVVQDVNSIETANIVEIARTNIKVNIGQFKDQIETAKKSQGRFKTAIARLTSKNPIVKEALEGHAAKFQQQIANLEVNISAGQQMLKVLEDYKYKTDELKHPTFTAGKFVFGGAGSW